MRRAVARRLGAPIVIVAALVTGCGAKDLVSVNEPLPDHAAMSFTVSKISGTDFVAPEGGTQEGGMQFNLANDTMIKSFTLWTRCGVVHSHNVEITADRIIGKDFDNLLNAAKCTSEQLVVAQRVAEVLSSSPRYRFDGTRLQLIDNKTTVTLAFRSKTDMVTGTPSTASST